MAARPDVFVSYSRHDKAFVEGTLLAALTARGKDVWIDLEDIPPADDWHEEVMAGVTAANAVLFVLSPDSVSSEICGQELSRAVELNKRLIPIVRRDPGPVPPALSRPNWIFLREQDDLDAGLAAVFEALDSDLEWRNAHSRLAVRANEWLAHDEDRSFLLRGSDLAAAETWLTQQAEHEERPTADQTRYVVASRQATTRRARVTLLAVVGALAVASALAVFALVQRQQAIDREHVARSRELAASALNALPRDPELAVLLADAGLREEPTGEAEDALRRSLADSYVTATLRGHRGPVQAGTFTPDGRSAVTVGNDGTVRIWDAASGRQTAVLEQGAALIGVAVSPDSRRIAAVGSDGSARLWDRSGTAIAELPGTTLTLFAPSFSRDGGLIVAPGVDGPARIWDGRDGTPVAVLRNAGTTWSAEFDRSGRRVVTACDDGNAYVWTVAGARTAVMRGHRGDVDQARFSPDGRLVATAGDDGTARLWDAGTGAERRILRGHTGPVRKLAFSPDGRRLATVSDDRTGALWDVATGRRVAQLTGHLDAVLSVAFSPDGTRIATASADNTARLWDGVSGRPVATFRGHTDEPGRPQFSADGQRLLTVSLDGTGRVWRVPRRTTAIAGGGPLKGAAISPDRSRVLTWTRRAQGRLVDTATGRVLARMPLVGDAAFLPGGRFVVAPGSPATAAEIREADGGTVVKPLSGQPASELAVSGDRIAAGGLAPGVRVWDASGRPLSQLDPDATALAVNLSPDGRRAIVMTDAGAIASWDTTTGKRLGTLDAVPGPLSPGAAFRADGARAVVTTFGTPVPVWDLRSSRPERLLQSHAQSLSEVVGVAWGGDRVAVADRSSSGAGRIFDVRTGGVVAELREHAKEIRSVAFSPDARWLVTASVDGTGRVWEAATGRPVLELLGHRGPLVSAAFAADGRHILTASKDGTARIHDCAVCAPLGDLERMVPGHTSRRLTPEERRVYLHD